MTFTGAIGAACMLPLRLIIKACVALGIHPNVLTLIGVLSNVAAGFALASHWSLLLVVIALFAFIYGPTIAQERAEIRSRFPDDYSRYEANVPPFTPRLTPWRGQSGAESFSLSLYMRQREWQAGLAFAAASSFLIARSYFGF